MGCYLCNDFSEHGQDMEYMCDECKEIEIESLKSDMTPEKIKCEIMKHEADISNIRKEIDKIQEICKHGDIKVGFCYGGDYSTECSICGKIEV